MVIDLVPSGVTSEGAVRYKREATRGSIPHIPPQGSCVRTFFAKLTAFAVLYAIEEVSAGKGGRPCHICGTHTHCKMNCPSRQD